MVRAPCCEKMGMKKGPWTPEEDQVLVDYIQGYGHGNWRALPKHAGLLRCGKSCRLRWTNYLRPDIKRGNFSKEEEETIIQLHGLLGNRWSAIAAKLPGRTDNEIKNVWHTHLKKRVIFSDPQSIMDNLLSDFEKDQQQPAPEYYPTTGHDDQARSDSTTITTCHVPISPQQSFSDDISISTSMNNNNNNILIYDDDNNIYDFSHGNDMMFNNDNDSFWLDVLSSTTTTSGGNYTVPPPGCEFPLSPFLAMEPVVHASTSSDSNIGDTNNGLLDMEDEDDMDFWYHVFKRAEEYSTDDFPGL